MPQIVFGRPAAGRASERAIDQTTPQCASPAAAGCAHSCATDPLHIEQSGYGTAIPNDLRGFHILTQAVPIYSYTRSNLCCCLRFSRGDERSNTGSGASGLAGVPDMTFIT